MPTPTPEKIREVLEELYALDPSLRSQGGALEELVISLLAAKPDAPVNARFLSSLRRQLTERMKSTPIPHSSFLSSMLNLKFILPTAALGAIAVVAAVVVTQPGLLPMRSSSGGESFSLASGLTVTRAGANAFGNLSGQDAVGLGGDLPLGAPGTRSQSGGGGGVPPMVPTALLAEDAKMAGELSLIAPVPDNFAYERLKFVYDGPELQLEPKATVYKRVKRGLDGSSLASAVRSLSLGVLDLSRFGNLAVQQLTLVEPGEYGYQIYVDLIEGFVNINENYLNWPRPLVSEGLRGSDIPDDATLIGMTDAFLAARGISTEAYGNPVVDRRWGGIQTLMAEGQEDEMLKRMSLLPAPEVVTVAYPLQVDGNMATDQSGFPYGLSVSVNIPAKRVSGVWNLVTQSYEASDYDAVTDAAAILDVASRGDVYSPPFGQDPNERVREVKIGEPTRVLMQSWRPLPDGRGGEEILVPALRFPIIRDGAAIADYRDAVVVPLIKELLTPPIMLYDTRAGGMGGSGTAPAVPIDPVAAPMLEPETEQKL